jgi:hypothetical protein
VCASVIERVGVTAKTKLSTFDRIGLVVVTLLGTCIGLEIGFASDIRLTPMLALLFPGPLIAPGIARILGLAASVWTVVIFSQLPRNTKRVGSIGCGWYAKCDLFCLIQVAHYKTWRRALDSLLHSSPDAHPTYKD